jgi:hypothetical protein
MKTPERAATFDKNGILSNVTARQSRKTGDFDAPKSTAQGAKCHNFTHERGALTVLERWAFLARMQESIAGLNESAFSELAYNR